MALKLYDEVNFQNIPMDYVSKNFECYVLLDTMEKYVNGAVLQWNRIQSARMRSLEYVRNEIEICQKRTEEISKIEDFQLRLQKLEEFNVEKNQKLEVIRAQRTINTSMLFLDIHFYFICCDKVQNAIEKLAKKENNEDLLWHQFSDSSLLWYNLCPHFKPYNDVRNHLEHIDERTKQKYAGDKGNLYGDKFTFGGKEFDISQDSLKFICDSYEKVLDTIK